jgi:hypothetical protein
MDFGDIQENLPVIITIIVLIVLQFVIRRRRSPETTQIGIVQNLISEININLRLAEVLISGEPIKRLITTNWQINKSKLDFLDTAVQTDLNDAYMIAEDFNQQVAATKKYKSPIYTASINSNRLKDKLTKGKEGLEKWLISKTGTKDPTQQAPGIFDSLIGRRR